MTQIAGIIFSLVPYLSFAAPGSYSGNVEDSGGSTTGLSLLLAVVGLPLALWVFSLICHQPAPADKKLNWWTSMDATGKGVTVMFALFLFLVVGMWLS